MYKRQIFKGVNAVCPEIIESLVHLPVSYTHLDVYKRQVCVCFHQSGLDRITQTVLGGLIDDIERLKCPHTG